MTDEQANEGVPTADGTQTADAAQTVDVLVPDNEEGTKATVLRWCKAVGESLDQDEALLELETDKVTVEVPAPVSGELQEILKQSSEEVLPGQVLARIRVGRQVSAGEASAGTSAQASTTARADASASLSARTAPNAAPPHATAPNTGRPSAAPPPNAPAPPSLPVVDEGGRALLSPAVRRLLSEHSLSIENLKGSGRAGRVTAQDVARHLGDARARVPHSAVRRRVAEHMARSLAQAPHVTTLFEADLSRVQAHRARHAMDFERAGAHLTYTAYFVAACARALMAHPVVNSTFHDDGLEMHSKAHVGIGTALGNDGLIVPVLRDAETLSLLETARGLGELVGAARAGKLTPQDVRGGTFTISNHGVGGSLLAAPIIIHQPQVAILGVGKVERRVCVIDAADGEAIAVRTMCYLTLSLDHRALDAFQANAFLTDVVASLESWDVESD